MQGYGPFGHSMSVVLFRRIVLLWLPLLGFLQVVAQQVAVWPILVWEGRYFSGIVGDYVDLAQLGFGYEDMALGGAMRISFFANFNSLKNNGCVLNFDNGPTSDNFMVQSASTMPDLVFRVRQGTDAALHS